MKKNILLLMTLCILLSSVSLSAQGNILPTAQNFAARDRDRDRSKGKHKKKHKETVRPRAHNKH